MECTLRVWLLLIRARFFPMRTKVHIRNRVEEEDDIKIETASVNTETASVEEKLEMRKSILQFVIGGVSALTLIILMQMEGSFVCY